MFRITFNQFRCWENLNIEVPIGGITLIKGSSGAGKSTIFQGITWCLYGNIRLVNPNHLEKAKTRVNIEFPYTLNDITGILRIERQKNPSRLILRHISPNSMVEHEDKVAQSIIDDLFGAYDIWMASCYIGQGCRNNFLTAPNTGKMELLNSIAFHEEDPSTYIERIDTTITEVDTEYKTKLSHFTANLEALQSMLTTTDLSKALTPEQIVGINTEITSTQTRLIQLQESKKKRDIDLGMLNNLQNQLTIEQSKVIYVPKPDTSLSTLIEKFGDNIDSSDHVDAIVNRTMQIIPLLQRRDQFKKELDQYEAYLVPYVNIDKNRRYTTADYQNAVAEEIAFNNNQGLAQQLKVSYNDIAIKEHIKQQQDILGAQERLKLEHEKNTLEVRINILETEQKQYSIQPPAPDLTAQLITQEIQVPDYSKYSTIPLSAELSELTQRQGAITAHIQHLQKGQGVLQCSHCKGPLRLQHGILVAADTAPANTDELIVAQQQLSQINSDIARVNRAVQSMVASESQERTAYERAVQMEQRRLDTVRERVRQMELDNQRREIAAQTRLKEISQLNQDIQKLNNIIITLPPVGANMKLLSKVELEQKHILIARLSNINILSAPLVSSIEIQSNINYHNLLEKQKVAVAAYKEYLGSIPELYRNESTNNLQTYMEKIMFYRSQVKASIDERMRLERLVASLQEQITTLINNIGVDPTMEITTASNEIADLKKALVLNDQAQIALKNHALVTKQREEIVQLNTTLADFQMFRQYAVDTECRILQEIVDSINASIQGVCSTLFDRDKDIVIALSLFKTMKATKNVKPIVNFTISYQGGTFDNINQMSGGEGDRASLALTLALNRLSSCPILMLDESLASLDLDMKEAAIRTIRENTNTTVLVIMHDGIDGLYDEIVNINEYRQGRY